ncbi:phage tail tape measure protein [Chryseobacterium sp. WG14]|uniref:phage tail tape measure protein n=1 Tax=Chryseobacterium sp. WG14 TaxID=2926909 RepID=UPI00211E436E|nr:phage tail tape measure protein [Chryseobacterium sp. WG14]MCQ9638607.1 phage tail tape measure protein [Chryseobacterium sp. WG14]
MAERIVLAQFDIDSRLLDDKIAQNKTKMDLLNGEIRDTKKVIKEYQDQAKLTAGVIEANNALQERANQDLAQGIITQEQYNTIINDTSQVIRQNEVELGNLLQTEREQQRQLVNYQTDLRAINDENRELNNLLRAGRTEVRGNEGAYTQLSQQLSATRVEANNLGAQMRLLERDGQQNSEEYANVARQWDIATREARELHEELLELDRATGDNRRNVGNYAQGIRDAFETMLSGDIKGGLDDLKEKFKDLKKGIGDLFNFIKSNPWIILVAAIVGYVKELYEYNAQVKELNKEVESIANTSGVLTDQLRKNAVAIQETYGKEFKEAVTEMKSLMDDFGVSAQEAFNIYNQGLALGGALSSEFGDSIREYGPLFAQSGYSAQEFINILNSGIDLGIYSDKLPDAIKEAGLSLKEQTKATRDALVNAYGASFSDDLLKKIQLGKITVSDGLDEIAKKSKTMYLNEQQLAQLTADVFKGAGEDAGGALKIFEALNHAQNINNETLSETQKQVIKLSELNLELANAKDEAFKSDSMMAFQSEITELWKEIQIIWYKSLGSITSFLQDAGKGWRLFAMNTSDLFKLIPVTFNKVVVALTDDLKQLASLAKLSGEIIKDSLTLNFDGVESKMKQLNSGISNIFSNTKREIKEFNSNLGVDGKINTKNIESIKAEEKARADAQRKLDAQNEKNANNSLGGIRDQINELKSKQALAKTKQEYDALQKQIDELEKRAGKITGSVADAANKEASDRQKLLDKQAKEAEAARKKAEKEAESAAKQDLANAKERANIAIQATQAELAEYIAMNAEKLKSDKRLTQARVNEIQKYLEDVREKTQIANEQEKQQKLKSLNDQIEAIKGYSDQELGQKKNLVSQKEIIEKEYATKELIINNDSNEKRKELDKTFLEQKRTTQNLARALELQQQITDLETKGTTEYAMQKAQLDQQIEQRLSSFLEENEIKRTLDQENYDLNAEIEAQRREIENQLAIEQDEIKKTNLQNLLSSLNIIQQDYANKDAKISQDKELAKWGLASSVAVGMAKVAGEQTEAGKTLAIAGATIDTIAGSVRALKDYPAPYSYILMGTTIAAGLAQVAKIQGVDTGGAEAGLAGITSAVSSFAPKKATKAANGMLIGPSHLEGGIPIKTPDGTIEAEGGEIIINKRSSAMYRDVLSKINQLGGGVKFAAGGIVGNVSSLPTIQNNFKSLIDMDLMRRVVGEAVLEGAMLGTQAGSQLGIVELSNNREIQNGANF